MLIIELGFLLTNITYGLLELFHYYIFVFLFLDSFIRMFIRPARSFGYIRVLIGFLSLIPIASFHGMAFLPFDVNFGIQQIILIIIAVSRAQHLSFLFAPFRANPAQSFVGGFVMFILLGAIFLSVPVSHHQAISFIDALYMSVSAVCVTGLSVVDIGTVFTPFGQLILLILIQVGGLGIMTFYALVTLSLNRRFLSRESKEFQEGWATENIKETFGIIKSIFVVTILVEAVGAVFIYQFMPVQIQGIQLSLFYAIFHSVSAFCNAGFSLFSDSLAIFSGSIGMVSVMSLLIFIGGIGFPVLFQLYHRFILQPSF